MNREEMQKFILKGRLLKEVFRQPTASEILAKVDKGLWSGHPLISLGIGTDGDYWLTEEERENHLEIIGTTGEGKSKFLEYLISQDLKRGNGLMLLDPSTGFQTGKNVLKHCAKLGIEKVIIIDPTHRWSHEKVIGLNPFHTELSLKEASVANVTDTLRVVFGTKDSSETPLINKVLPAILHVLHEKELSLYETLYFSDFGYLSERRDILDQNNRYASYLRNNSFKPATFNEAIGSTVRRLEPIFHGILSLMFAIDGVDFTQVVREGYVVLVNLSSFRLEPLHNRLLGTSLINQLVFAIDRMFENGWKGVYYLYIDEVGEYANRKLAHLLAYKRKAGLRLNLAHQYDAQFEDKFVLDAVKNLTKTKIAFYIPNAEDRLKFIKNAFGGSLADGEVSYVLGQQKKQHAVIKKGKEAAAVIRIQDVKTPDIDIDSYVEKLLSRPFFFSPKEIRDVINQRKNNKFSSRGASTQHGTASEPSKRKRKQRSDSAPKTQGQEQTDPVKTTRPETDPFMVAKNIKGTKRDNE